MSADPTTTVPPVSNGSDVPAKLQDEYAKVKIGLAATGVSAVVGLVVGEGLGIISTANTVAAEATPVFFTLVGLAISFFFKK